ncbi:MULTISPECIES: ankyrin repeat domain-containing protein [unclassified Achromobacter]|uniref:ankyrin repeat domain-containing protein n=1 Tax=unclassified Achromobacter TaxID=2626865 RepID=UPI000B51E4E9|nr:MULTISPECIES: ankyrin repeat domain-containing protein [unclassified Achromobacter]OWT71499.1 hypothetical protein CEY05_25265 [Achromobacter sp. HZ34]OWT73156.1 hypothetical protein CEY04_24100 [Achromobacter sp. HZ28]
MKKFLRWPYILPTVLAVAMLCIYLLALSGGNAAHDGSGPDPVGLILMLVVWILGIGLALTTLYAMFARRRTGAVKGHRARVIGFHAALWLVVAIGIYTPEIRESFSRRAVHQTAAWRAPETVAHGTLKQVERAYLQARQETDDPSVLNSAMTSAALSYFRVDVLKFLKDQGVSLAQPGQENAWIDSIVRVLRASRDDKPQATLETVQWLMDEGGKQGFSLKARATDFSAITFYFTAYEDVNNPATRQLLDLLVAHGADTVGCKGKAPCPLIYVAGKGLVTTVRYLLSQGADPNSVTTGADETALASAIRDRNSEIVKLLLDAGARPRFRVHDNDIALACETQSGSDIEASKRVIQVLRAGNLHMTADDLARYQGPIYSEDQRACIRSFM